MLSTVLFSQQDGLNGHMEQSSHIISAIRKQANLFIPLSHHFRANLSQTLFFLKIYFYLCALHMILCVSARASGEIRRKHRIL